MDPTQGSDAISDSPPTFPPAWYPDPWRVAPWRWWDGNQWTPVLYGDYGEAWPLAYSPRPVREPKGPGIKGGGIAAVGAGVGLVGSVIVAVVYLIVNGLHSSLDVNGPWYLLASEIPLWVGFVGATVVASRMNGSGSLVRDYGLSWPTRGDLGLGALGGIVGRLWPLLLLILLDLASQGSLGSSNGNAPQILGATPSGVSGWLVLIVITVIGAPLVEEVFFRGLIQGAFTRRVGATPSIFITALLFVAAHVTGEGILSPIVLFPMALILGYLRQRTGRLAAGMVAHATFNATVLLLFLVPAFR